MTPQPPPGIAVRKVVVSLDDGEWWAMDQDGDIRTFLTPERAVAWVKGVDKKAAKEGQSTATVIDWRNVPNGFTPPNRK